MTLHRVVIFRVKHTISDTEQTRRGIILLVLLFTQPILIFFTLIPFFSEKHSKRTGFYGQNKDILIPPQIANFQMSIFFETEKSAQLVSYFVSALVLLLEPDNFSSEMVGTNWVPTTELPNYLDFLKNETLKNRIFFEIFALRQSKNCFSDNVH